MSEIQPALNAAEWREILANEEKVRAGFLPDHIGSEWTPEGVAAATLWRNEWFTRGDVIRHLSDARWLESTLDAQGPLPSWDFTAEEIDARRRHANWHRSMAARIAALLPPEEEG